MRIAAICPSNQWDCKAFWCQVDQNEQAEVRAAAVYDKPIDRPAIREQVIGAILAYAIPAGNA